MKKLLALLLILPALARADDPDTVCRTHLKHLGGAVKAYQLTHSDKLPAKLSDLYLDGFIDSYSDFVCPASGTTITMTSEIDAKSDYELGTGGLLVREKVAHHAGKALAMTADGSIKPVEGAAAPAVAAAVPEAPVTKAPVTTTPVPPRSTSTATTTAPAPTTVMRDAGPAPADIATTSTTEEKPMFKVTKVDPGMAVSVDGAFGDFMGVTFAFQADGKLVVGSVKADSIGADIGFKAGDVVVEINEKPAPKGTGARTVTTEELGKLVGAPAGQSLLITVQKADGERVSFSFMTGMPALPGR